MVMQHPRPQPITLRILMLHGFTQSGALFHAKTRALEKNLKKAFPSPKYDVSLFYPTGPCQVRSPNVTSTFTAPSEGDAADADDPDDSWGWFQRKGDASSYVYEGIHEGLARIAQTLETDGPFQGVIGFSQGGFMASCVASLLEPGRKAVLDEEAGNGGMKFPLSFIKDEPEKIPDGSGDILGIIHPPLRFAVSYSGFAPPPGGGYDVLYKPKIVTPMLHYIGSNDTVVEERRSVALIDGCEPHRDTAAGGRRVVYHPGGHFVPASQRQCLLPLVAFIKEAMGC